MKKDEQWEPNWAFLRCDIRKLFLPHFARTCMYVHILMNILLAQKCVPPHIKTDIASRHSNKPTFFFFLLSVAILSQNSPYIFFAFYVALNNIWKWHLELPSIMQCERHSLTRRKNFTSCFSNVFPIYIKRKMQRWRQQRVVYKLRLSGAVSYEYLKAHMRVKFKLKFQPLKLIRLTLNWQIKPFFSDVSKCQQRNIHFLCSYTHAHLLRVKFSLMAACDEYLQKKLAKLNFFPHLSRKIQKRIHRYGKNKCECKEF